MNTPTVRNYRPSAIESAMAEAHYPLQALLDPAALHRYLRWRQPGYDPDHHLGGVLYLFLRGMSAAEPTMFGEWTMRGLVVASSGLNWSLRPATLFDQGSRR